MDSKRAGGREMQAQTPPSGPTLCRTGCGFYAHSAFDGMCSKCYKDHMSSTLNSSASSTSTTGTPLLAKGSSMLLHSRHFLCVRHWVENLKSRLGNSSIFSQEFKPPMVKGCGFLNGQTCFDSHQEVLHKSLFVLGRAVSHNFFNAPTEP